MSLKSAARTAFLFTFIACLFALSSVTAEAFTISKAQTNNLGLVGHWTFDGVTTGRIDDKSGNGNHGSMVNMATSSAYVRGKVGQALKFDGVDDYVTATDIEAIEGVGAISMSVWIKPSNFNGGAAGIAEKAGPNADLFELQLESDGDISFRLWNASNTLGTGWYSSAVTTLNVWYHVVAVYDGAQVKVYVNNVAGETVGSLSGNTANSTSGFTISYDGSAAGSIGSRFLGAVDDFRIYSRALTAAEITAIYNHGAGSKITTTRKAGANGGLADGLVGHWTFDGKDMPSGRVNDVSGNGNHGTVSGIATSTFYTKGKIGQALNFDGVDDTVNLGNIVNADNVEALSVSAWVRFNNSDSSVSEYIVSKNRSGFSTWLLYRTSTETFGFFIVNSAVETATAISDASYRDTAWHHVVGVYNGANVHIYVDGVSADATPPALTGTVRDRSEVVCVGASDSGSGCTSSFFGSKAVDDVRIYNRALSANEVQQLYNLGAGQKIGVSTQTTARGGGSGLVGHWTFDGKDMPSGAVHDVSGNGNHGTVSGIATSTFYTRGKIGQAVRFDGVDDYVDTGDPVSADGISEITVSAWFKSAVADTGRQYIVSKEKGGFAGWSFRRESTEVFTFNIFNANPTVTASSATFRDTLWHHVVATYNGAAIQIYVDGIASGSSAAQTGDLSATTRNLCIGIGDNLTTCSGGSNPANALIDDVRIYNRALSASEILQLYNAGR